ncbi:transposase [Comamonas testosteroni]|uniref:transposase n=1 Tax=Comamonas testosteroni TaxID=285 RepID=UPI003AF3E0A6
MSLTFVQVVGLLLDVDSSQRRHELSDVSCSLQAFGSCCSHPLCALENQVKRKQFTDAQIREILAEVERGGRLVDTCRKFSISPTSYYRWRDARLKNAPSVGALEYQRLAEEHARLKRMYGELALRYNMLSEARR